VTRRLPSRIFRLFCALAVAFVTTFHVCGIATASAEASTAIFAAAANDGPRDESGPPSAEKCHVCATLSLPSLLAVTDAPLGKVPVRAAPVRGLVSFQTPLSPPPPRA
jgi:hypothetical protein